LENGGAVPWGGPSDTFVQADRDSLRHRGARVDTMNKEKLHQLEELGDRVHELRGYL
jgi:hypothetical protein